MPAEVATCEVARERVFIGVPAQHRLAGSAAVRLGDLAGERLILFPRERNPGLYDDLIDEVGVGGSRDLDVEEASSRQVAAGLVAAGLGVSTFTDSMRSMAGPGVAFVPVVDPERHVTLLMGWLEAAANPLLGFVPSVDEHEAA